MTTWTSSVEDPEKHFLGNLLDDESFSTSPPRPRQEERNVSIPSVSVISGVGPIAPASSAFWPEPPPPYSPTNRSTDWTLNGTTNSLQDIFAVPLPKEEPHWDQFFTADTAFRAHLHQPPPKLRTPSPQIHHHHHNLHHHTHLHNVVENHHHYLEAIRPPPGLNISKPFAQVVAQQSNAPHSAPVSGKMPFSYRDVAARSESSSNGNSPPQAARKTASPGVETRSEHSISQEESGNINAIGFNSLNRSKKEDQEFKKISRKRNGKEMKQSETSSSPPLYSAQTIVDEPTKYQLLEKLVLSSPKIVKNLQPCEESDGNEDASLSNVVKCSRSSSDGPDEEDIVRVRRLEHQKKKTNMPTTSTGSKKRGLSKKKEDEHTWVVFWIICTYLYKLWDLIQGGFQWLLTLVVDVSCTMMDIVSYGCQYAFDCFCNTIHRYAMIIVTFIVNSFKSLVACSSKNSKVPLMECSRKKMLGLESTINIPNNVEDAICRLLRLHHADAYSVLGLSCKCTAEEIRRNSKKMFALLESSINFKYVDGAAEALQLTTVACSILQDPTKRREYKFDDLDQNIDHQEFAEIYESFMQEIERSKYSLFCDCGHRHARIPTDIRPTEARYCRRCAIYHSARNNDIWVETSFMGTVWNYYTCSEGVVYNITEWATCDMNYLKLLRPYSHNVQYRLLTPGAANERVLGELLDEQEHRGGAQASFCPTEQREDDRSRRAANRRQKRRY